MTSGPLARPRLTLSRSPLNSLGAPAAVAVLAMLLGTACEGGSPAVCNTPGADAGAVVATTALETFIEQTAAAACAWQFRCCSLPEIDALSGAGYQTEAECRTASSHLLSRSFSEVRFAFRQGHISIDPALAAACVEQLRNGTCNEFAQVADLSPGATDRVNQCASPFVGHLPPDALCLLAAECRPGSSCSFGSSQDNSVTPAGLRPGISVGSAINSYIGHCQPDTKDGEPCFLTSECPVGLYCRHTDFVCARPVAEGESCSSQRDMVGNPLGVTCAESPRPLLCVGNRCRHLPRRDEPCLPVNLSTSVCDPAPALGLTCVGRDFNGSGICKSYARQGEICSFFSNGLPPCEPPLTCTMDSTDSSVGFGTCQPPPGVGASCSDQVHCTPPAVCYSGGGAEATCVLPPPVPTGNACRSDLDCASLNCAGNADVPAIPSQCSPYDSPVMCAGAGRSFVVGNNPPRDGVPDDGAQVLGGE
jgi:hypothetical protein